MSERKLGFATLQVHGGQEPDSATGDRAVPHHIVLKVLSTELIYFH